MVVEVQITDIWVVTLCSLAGNLPTYHRNMLPPSSPWQHFPLKCWLAPTRPCSATSQKTTVCTILEVAHPFSFVSVHLKIQDGRKEFKNMYRKETYQHEISILCFSCIH
jgi:hypothetical protein